MKKQTIMRGLPTPIYRNETINNQHIQRGGVYINETPGMSFPAPMNGLGTGGPYFPDRLVT